MTIEDIPAYRRRRYGAVALDPEGECLPAVGRLVGHFSAILFKFVYCRSCLFNCWLWIMSIQPFINVIVIEPHLQFSPYVLGLVNGTRPFGTSITIMDIVAHKLGFWWECLKLFFMGCQSQQLVSAPFPNKKSERLTLPEQTQELQKKIQNQNNIL